MCGIGGVISREPFEEDALLALRAALSHRGPDDSLSVVTRLPRNMVGLCATRLAIQDVSALGRQPMTSVRTGSQICFNGEIYNVLDLRNRLEGLGYEFRGRSDTEVVLAAYDAWGPDCVARLRGMFAIAIWDATRERLFLARDRLGIKPLYFSRRPDTIVFGSEVRSLLATGLVPRELSMPGLMSYLGLGAVREPFTILQGIDPLPAGHYAIWDAGEFNITQYWSLADAFLGDPKCRVEDADDHLRQLLVRAVGLHLVSEVPLGVFLSGGIDSTALVGLVSSVAESPPRTVSVVFPDERYTEAGYIDTVRGHFGTDHTEIVLDESEIRQRLPHALSAMDQPTFDGVNTYIVSEVALRSGLTVALAGVGGDELFAGYDTFRLVPRLERLRHIAPPGSSRGRLLAQAARLAPDSDRAMKFKDWVVGGAGQASAYDARRRLFSLAQIAHLNTARTVDTSLDMGAPDAIDDCNRVSFLELDVYMRNVLLRDVDVMSMAHGLEVRVPFLDHEVVEFVAALPGGPKLARREPKPLLVSAVRDLLPTSVASRRKAGFLLPFADWLAGPLRDQIGESLLDDRFGGQVADVLDHDAVKEVWERFASGRGHWTRPWALYALKHWAEEHLSLHSTTSRVG